MAEGNKNNKESAQEILKRIESESGEDKRKRAINILEGKEKVPKEPAPKINYWRVGKNIYDRLTQKYIKKFHNADFQKTAIITCFFIFSTYLCWKIEAKYDGMRKKATQTKTFKEAQIEQENDYINRYLSQKEFVPVQIKNELEPKNSYKFEEDEGVMDTKDYLLEQVAKEYKEGTQIDSEMEKELRSRGMI